MKIRVWQWQGCGIRKLQTSENRWAPVLWQGTPHCKLRNSTGKSTEPSDRMRAISEVTLRKRLYTTWPGLWPEVRGLFCLPLLLLPLSKETWEWKNIFSQVKRKEEMRWRRSESGEDTEESQCTKLLPPSDQQVVPHVDNVSLLLMILISG